MAPETWSRHTRAVGASCVLACGSDATTTGAAATVKDLLTFKERAYIAGVISRHPICQTDTDHEHWLTHRKLKWQQRQSRVFE